MPLTLSDWNEIARNLGQDFARIVEAGVRWYRLLTFPTLPPEYAGWKAREYTRMDGLVARATSASLTERDLFELAAILGVVPVTVPYGLGALGLRQELRCY